MSQVILVTPCRPERRAGLVAAAQLLGELVGGARVVECAPRAVRQADAMAGAPPPGGAPDEAADIVERGSRADFLVVEQRDPDEDKAARAMLRAAVLKTERPVLLMPRGVASGAFGRRVAVAWRDDALTMKAVMSALRLLSRAQEVHLLAGVRAGTPTPPIPAVLLEHGVRATLHVLVIGAAPFGEQLLSRAHELGADLLVMGAHAHTRLHDLLLGGVTNYVVTHTDMPVLLRH